MAINDIFKSVTVGGVNSLDYGVYITGEAVYNAPERRVEFISIPGRNGDLILDGGVFENIEVKYPAGTFGDDQSDFSEKIQAYRNALKAQRGYQRITDDYHPDEFRLGVLVDAIEVDAVQQNKGGEFDIVFNCKPQRFLTSGETAVDVLAPGSLRGELTNPSLFGSSPLLAITGAGTLDIESDNSDKVYSIELVDQVAGRVELLPAGTFERTPVSTAQDVNWSRSLGTPFYLVNDGDSIGMSSFSVNIAFRVASNATADSITISRTSSGIANYNGHTQERVDARTIGVTFSYGAQSFTKSSSTTSFEESFSVVLNKTADGQTGTITATFKIAIAIVRGKTFRIGVTDVTVTGGILTRIISGEAAALIADSTQSVLGDPTYIDFDIGEAYRIVNNEILSLNRYVSLGSDLAVLEPGRNVFHRYSTAEFESVLCTPRWWII